MSAETQEVSPVLGILLLLVIFVGGAILLIPED